jgi:pyruvate dehydrogenase E1 component alpha subunit
MTVLTNVKADAQRNESAPTPAADRIAAKFEVRYRQFVDPAGRPVAEVPPFALDRGAMVALYRAMTLTRQFDAKAVSLQRTGQLGTFPSSLGQEASTVGLAAAMHADDVLLPTYREHGALLWRGVTFVEMFLSWSGDERGNAYSGPREDFPPAIPIATQATQAAGVATAMMLRGQKRCAVCVLGDGATSKGDFYEAMNLAGVWQLPVVFVANNNRWAISVPIESQTACETLAQKAIAGGFEGEQVDGNDVVAVRHAVGEAVERARAGGGPSLVETLTYRLSDHTTADDATRYRPDEEVSAAWPNDPLARVRAYIGDAGWWSKSDEESLIIEAKETIDRAVEAYLATPPQPPTAIFDSLYETLPASLFRQRAMVEGDGIG